MRYVLGLIGIAVGFVLIWKAEWILNNFGRIDWAEQHLGSEGGTRLMWKLIGLLIILISMAFMFGMLQTMLLAILSPLFRGMAQ